MGAASCGGDGAPSRVRDATATAETAGFALSVLDLTNLSATCDAAQVDALCARARTPFGHAAAVCIWPRFVAGARGRLGPRHPVRIATVVNFPSGAMTAETAASEARTAVADGADEIDMVLPYRRLIAGEADAASAMVAAVRGACPDSVLKVILETGELKDPALIARASDMAVAGGADFLKTSTGKVAVNATPDAAAIMLAAIRRGGRRVGFKAAGGIGSVAVAARYLDLAASAMGPDWATPSTFRFGASGLLDDILAVLGGGVSGASPGDY